MIRLASAALVLSLSTGCTIPAAILLVDALDGPNGDPDIYMFDDYESNATGVMRGEMPEAGSFDRELTRASVWNYDFGLDFDLHATDGNWAMLAGGFEVDLQDGESVVLGPDEHWIIGCSGPSEYNAYFDQSPDEVEIQKEVVEIEGELMVQLTIIASFGTDGEVTAVVVQPQPEPNPED